MFRDEKATAAFAIATRVSGTSISFLSAFVAVAFLTPEKIGVFLSFAGLAAFSVIADLGLNQSVLLASSSAPVEDPAELRNAGLTVLAPTVALTGTFQFMIGEAFLSRATANDWLPWAAFCVFSSVYQCLYLFVVIVEGTYRRLAAWRANFILEVLGGLTLLAAIIVKQELWGFAAGVFIRSMLVLLIFHREFYGHRSQKGAARSTPVLYTWRTKILPMQWKTAVNMLSGLITTRLLTPILLVTNDAATAGRIGLGLSLTAAVVGVSTAWPQSETAIYVRLFHERDFAGLFRYARDTAIRSLVFCVCASISAGAGVVILRNARHGLADKLPSLEVLAPLLATAPIAHLTYNLAIIIRSQRNDPVVIVNAAFGAILLIALWWAAAKGPGEFCLMFLAGAFAGLVLYGAYYFAWRRALLDVHARP